MKESGAGATAASAARTGGLVNEDRAQYGTAGSGRSRQRQQRPQGAFPV